MTSLVSWIRRSVRRAPSRLLRFDSPNFKTFSQDQILEEESFYDGKLWVYYPVCIGEVLASRYQVTGKLGYGISSTVWLARDIEAHRHVVLKIFTLNKDNTDEIDIYKHLSSVKASHTGTRYVRDSLDAFELAGKHGQHSCLVHVPLWESLKALLLRNPSGRLPEEMLRACLHRLFLALDFLHTEAKIIHTDIKAANILQEIADPSILDAFVSAEVESPSPRKTVDGVTVYASRRLARPKVFGEPVLCDFGSAVHGDVDHEENAQPAVYKSPEVVLHMNWSYSIDIWNVGVMIWDLFEGKHLFHGFDPETGKYSGRAHLAEMIAVMGPPPLEFLKTGRRSLEFFDDHGKWRGGVPVPAELTLESSEENLHDKNKEAFLRFVRSMVQWKPQDRKSAKQLLEDPWLLNEVE